MVDVTAHNCSCACVRPRTLTAATGCQLPPAHLHDLSRVLSHHVAAHHLV
jgi:hypothetical protein